MIIDEISEFLVRGLNEIPRVEKIVINPCFSGALLENGDMGVCMNVRKGTGYSDAALNELLGRCIGGDAVAAGSRLAVVDDPLARSVHIALVNAMCRPFMTRDHLEKMGYGVRWGNAARSDHDITKDDTVVIVGFGGNVRSVSEKAAKVFVTELVPEMFRSTVIEKSGVKNGPFCAELVHADGAAAALDEADVVLLTGCTLVTGTMEQILENCRGKRVIVYGFSASFVPAPLFERGVDAVSTRQITDAATMMSLLSNCAGMVERFFPMASQDVLITPDGSEAPENRRKQGNE